MRLDEFEQAYLQKRANDPQVDEEASFQAALSECVEHFQQRLHASSADRVAAERESRAEFAEQLMDRWREGLDALDAFILLCSDLGETLVSVTMPDTDKSWKHQALFTTHGRCLRVSREVLCLLSNGFADGALGRWRTLHELAVVTRFLAANDEELSRRYMFHRAGQAHRSAVIYQRFSERTSSTPISDDTMERLTREKDDLVAEHGEQILEDWGWAASVIHKKKVRFSDIEEAQGRDLMRPNYKWASEDIHGNFNPFGGTLGTNGGDPTGLLVGASLHGLLDPAYWTALALTDATSAILLYAPTLDRMALASVVAAEANRIGETFHRVHLAMMTTGTDHVGK